MSVQPTPTEFLVKVYDSLKAETGEKLEKPLKPENIEAIANQVILEEKEGQLQFSQKPLRRWWHVFDDILKTVLPFFFPKLSESTRYNTSIKAISEQVIAASKDPKIEQKSRAKINNLINILNHISDKKLHASFTIPPLAKPVVKVVQGKELETQQLAAATKIESVWRGYSSRVIKEKNLLSYKLLTKAKPFVKDEQKLRELPRAGMGRTPVFLPKELPIVLKQSGSPKNQERFEKMKQARFICEKNGFHHLTIPSARVQGNFIIESRLPIHKPHTKEQIGLYMENREKFSQAAKEFTGFLCQAGLGDIVGGSNNPFQDLSQKDIARYDNVPLYLEKEQGKLGLIDLEDFMPYCFGGASCACERAVSFFPYHLDAIIEEAKKFDQYIEYDRSNLESIRDETLNYFKLAYGDHLAFIQKKGISIKEPTRMVEISAERSAEIQRKITSLIQKENEEYWYKNCLGKNPKEAIVNFEKAFPVIFNTITAFLSKQIAKNIAEEGEPISSIPKLLCCRTLGFDFHDLMYQDLMKQTVSKLDKIDIPDADKKTGFADMIIKAVFEELAKGGEIAYYNPRFGGRCQCIFC